MCMRACVHVYLTARTMCMQIIHSETTNIVFIRRESVRACVRACVHACLFYKILFARIS